MKQNSFENENVSFNLSYSQENDFQNKKEEYNKEKAKGFNNIQVVGPQKANENRVNEIIHSNMNSKHNINNSDLHINSRKLKETEKERDEKFLFLKREINGILTEKQDFFINKCKELLTEDLYKYFENKFAQFCTTEDVKKMIDIQNVPNITLFRKIAEDNRNEINKINEFNYILEKELNLLKQKIENMDKKISFLNAIELKINNLFSEIEIVKKNLDSKESNSQNNSPHQTFPFKNLCGSVNEISKTKNFADSLICIKEEFQQISNSKSEFHSEISDNYNNILSNLTEKIYLVETQGNKCSEGLIQIQSQYEQLINEMKNVRHIIFTNQSLLINNNVNNLCLRDKKIALKKNSSNYCLIDDAENIEKFIQKLFSNNIKNHDEAYLKFLANINEIYNNTSIFYSEFEPKIINDYKKQCILLYHFDDYFFAIEEDKNRVLKDKAINQIVQTEMMYSDIGVKEIIYDYGIPNQILDSFVVKKSPEKSIQKKIRSADCKLNGSSRIQTNNENNFSFHNEEHFRTNRFLISPRYIREHVSHTPYIFYEKVSNLNNKNHNNYYIPLKTDSENEGNLKYNGNNSIKITDTQNVINCRNFENEGHKKVNIKGQNSLTDKVIINKEANNELIVNNKSICNRAKVIEINSKFWPEKILPCKNKNKNQIENPKSEEFYERNRKEKLSKTAKKMSDKIITFFQENEEIKKNNEQI